MRTRWLLLAATAAVVISACGSSDQSEPLTADLTGAGGATAGSGGAAAGSGGATAGSGGDTAGSGGDTAGSGGATAGSGGATAGSGGATAGSGGATTGSGGATTGMGGKTGTGGAMGTGGATGTGGTGGKADAGTGGSSGMDAAACEAPSTATGNQMNAGQACLSCHAKTSMKASLRFTLAGSLYTTAAGTAPVTGATIVVTDANNVVRKIPTFAQGAFYSTAAFAFPVKVAASKCPDHAAMPATASTGDCNSCHVSGTRIHLP